ncbi:MAG TPA: aminofutalosine synthase MqnE [Bacteroidales bacterium]|nr:aminofutalosine synthase MqnE [Bacteroidales bacterium]
MTTFQHIFASSIKPELKLIAEKVQNNIEISIEDGILLYKEVELSFLAVLANFIKEQKHGNNVYYNKNFHIEPTNICIHGCKFCSYSRKEGEDGAWEHTIEDIVKIVESYKDKSVTECHIVGGVHTNKDIHYYCKMLREIKKVAPELHLKAFSAVEIDHMITKSNLAIADGLKLLKNAGLDSIPGGGAEIFDEEIRKKICPNKTKSQKWLEIHETCHKLGLKTNATMLYGHIEKYEHRINHLNRLRELQHKTNGFMSFIPLKFKRYNNELSSVTETSTLEDLRNYCVSRIFLTNFQHIKAYWPMIGRDVAQISLDFGVDDLDGTVDDTTKIYTMAGVKENPAMNSDEIISLIKRVKKNPVERNSTYSRIERD